MACGATEACVASVCVADAGCADPTPDPVATYRIAINDFNFAGGQDYTIFGERSTETSSGILLIEAMERGSRSLSEGRPRTVVTASFGGARSRALMSAVAGAGL